MVDKIKLLFLPENSKQMGQIYGWYINIEEKDKRRPTK